MPMSISTLSLWQILLVLSSGNVLVSAAALQSAGRATSVSATGVSRAGAYVGQTTTTSALTTTSPTNGTHGSLMGRNDTALSAVFSSDQLDEVASLDANDGNKALRVLFLSSDTGGGHRASAQALAKQFEEHYPGSTYDLVDVWTLDGVYPYNNLVATYKHFSANPSQWRIFYHLSNTVPNGFLANVHSGVMCEKKIRKRIAAYDPDVVVSVHPAMNNVPRISTRKLSKEHGKHIPFFTVVTDLGSGHSMWFERQVEKVYVASERIRKLARRRGRTPNDKIVMTGLPIRHDFALQAENMGDRTTESGKEYQKVVRKQLDLDTDKRMILVMGGGEGVGSLSDIVNELYVKFTEQGVDATICVVCGRNEKLMNDLGERDWDAVITDSQQPKKERRFRSANRSKEIQAALDRAEETEGSEKKGDVTVIGLGYVNGMADYMVAADVLVSKAGPGTIAEAAALGLPVMMTSYLPGQEAGNVDVVLDAGFGDYCKDPDEIAREVACWLKDDELLATMSKSASEVGQPTAAADIVQDIGNITHAWIDINLAANNGERRSILTSSL